MFWARWRSRTCVGRTCASTSRVEVATVLNADKIRISEVSGLCSGVADGFCPVAGRARPLKRSPLYIVHSHYLQSCKTLCPGWRSKFSRGVCGQSLHSFGHSVFISRVYHYTNGEDHYMDSEDDVVFTFSPFEKRQGSINWTQGEKFKGVHMRVSYHFGSSDNSYPVK